MDADSLVIEPKGQVFATPKQASQFLNLSKASVYRLMDARELASANFGRSRRIPWKALKEYASAKLHVEG